MKKSALLAALCLSLLGLVAPSPASADGELVVTWPEVTQFNPDHTPYVFHVEDSEGIGDLYVEWDGGGPRVGIPHSGDVVMEFPRQDFSSGSIRVYRCTASDGCSYVAYSPYLSVVRGIVTQADQSFGPAGIGLHLSPLEAVTSVTWELRASADSAPLTTGSVSTFRQDADGTIRLPLEDQAGLVHGKSYSLHLKAEGDTPTYGPLERELTTTVRYDDRVEGRITKNIPIVYSEEDGYRDRVRVAYIDGEPIKDFALEVLRSDGRRASLLKTAGLYPGTAPVRASWDGSRYGRRVAPGTYYLRVRGADLAGNRVDIRESLQLSRRRLVWETWSRKFTAQSRLSAMDVGRCSTLARRSDGGLGLYSQTKCRRASQSVVATQSGAYLPRSLLHEYQNIRVTLYGGRASGQRDAYVVMYYVNRDGELDYRRQFGGKRGEHIGQFTDSASVVHDRKTKQPYVMWFVGLTAGSRYDVDSYRVTLERQVLN